MVIFCAESDGEAMRKQNNIEDADVVVDLSGGKDVAEKYRKRIQQLQAELVELKRPMESAGFKADGMIAVGQELIRRDKQIKQLQAELIELQAEKGMVDMGFVSKGADAKTERLQAELDKLRWIPVSEMPEHLAARIELLTHRGWVDCGVKDAYGKGFNIGTGRLYFSAGYYTHYREVILPEQAPKEVGG